jgi:hypothetical protein
VQGAVEDLRLLLDVPLVDLQPRLLRAEHETSCVVARGPSSPLSIRE